MRGIPVGGALLAQSRRGKFVRKGPFRDIRSNHRVRRTAGEEQFNEHRAVGTAGRGSAAGDSDSFARLKVSALKRPDCACVRRILNSTSKVNLPLIRRLSRLAHANRREGAEVEFVAATAIGEGLL